MGTGNTGSPFVGVGGLKLDTSGSTQFEINTGRKITLYLKPDEAAALLAKVTEANNANSTTGIRLDVHYGKKKLPATSSRNAGGIIDAAFLVIKPKETGEQREARVNAAF